MILIAMLFNVKVLAAMYCDTNKENTLLCFDLLNLSYRSD